MVVASTGSFCLQNDQNDNYFVCQSGSCFESLSLFFGHHFDGQVTFEVLRPHLLISCLQNSICRVKFFIDENIQEAENTLFG